MTLIKSKPAFKQRCTLIRYSRGLGRLAEYRRTVYFRSLCVYHSELFVVGKVMDDDKQLFDRSGYPPGLCLVLVLFRVLWPLLSWGSKNVRVQFYCLGTFSALYLDGLLDRSWEILISLDLLLDLRRDGYAQQLCLYLFGINLILEYWSPL